MSRADWERLAAYAQERGVLDDVDRALIDTLAAKARREDDLAFRVVLACLVAAVREGGLRIPIAGAELEALIAEWLRGLYAAAAAEPGVDPDPRDFPEPASLAARMAEDFTAARLDGAYSAALGRPNDFLPLIEFGSGLYFQRYHAAEALAGARLRALIDAPDQAHPPAAAESALMAVLERHPLRLGGPGGPTMRFEGAQRAALELALRKRFTVISGGPGTGKTSLAANLLRAWLRLRAEDSPRTARPPRVKLAAPTGRAAQRLAESLRQSLASLAGPDPDPVGQAADAAAAGLGCSTLHALLRYQPSTGGFFHHAHRPLPADLVVVDEVSMVDIFLLARLLDALEPGACLILLGDMDQLPSVEAGSVLADLAPSGTSGHPLRGNLATLDRGHRSGAGILQVTRCVNAMDAEAALAAMLPPVPVLPPPWPAIVRKGSEGQERRGEGCRMLLPPAAGAFRAGLEACLESWMDFHYLGRDAGPAPRRAYAELVSELGDSRHEDGARADLLAQAFAYLDQARILTFTRKGWHGAVHINRVLCERLGRRLDPHAPPGSGPGFAGMPLLVLENDPARGLFNGDVGLQLRMGGRSVAWFRRAEGFQEFPIAFLPRHEPAFAMTIHKAQGSEYDQILLVLPEAGNRLLFKETLYTALTRARHFAALYGPVEVFREAVGRKVVRESGLAAYLSAPGPG